MSGLAQPVEHGALIPGVGGSSPSPAAMFRFHTWCSLAHAFYRLSDWCFERAVRVAVREDIP
jgi:hypothetical protein